MKKLIAVAAIMPVIAGCSALFPGKTFQTADFVCTQGDAEFEFDAKELVDAVKGAFQLFTVGPGGSIAMNRERSSVSSEDVEKMLQACKDFLAS
ncbi:MAG: hypothetical protein OYH76_17495 [Defluviicoccus sp.]|nr:hypothetical protein [Defluviicoccus sp.]MDE0277692.1 hypothetical protein [Defluviicoccus sp.]